MLIMTIIKTRHDNYPMQEYNHNAQRNYHFEITYI